MVIPPIVGVVFVIFSCGHIANVFIVYVIAFKRLATAAAAVLVAVAYLNIVVVCFIFYVARAISMSVEMYCMQSEWPCFL